MTLHNDRYLKRSRAKTTYYHHNYVWGEMTQIYLFSRNTELMISWVEFKHE